MSAEKLEIELEKLGQLKELWQKIANKEVLPLAVFPQKGKVVLINRKLRKKDLPELDGVKIAFTPLESNKKYLQEKGILLGDFSKVSRVLDFFYVSSQDLKPLQSEKEEISLEEIVTNYRKEKSKSF